MRENQSDDDYVWHFKLTEQGAREQGPNALTEMVREQVEALLRLLTFTEDGRDVRVTGFRFLNGDAEVRLRSNLRPSSEQDAAEGLETPGDAHS